MSNFRGQVTPSEDVCRDHKFRHFDLPQRGDLPKKSKGRLGNLLILQKLDSFRVNAVEKIHCVVNPVYFEVTAASCPPRCSKGLPANSTGIQAGRDILIDEAEDLPSSSAFRNRFGSLVSAYCLIGYDPEIDYSFIEINRQIRRKHPEIVAEVLEKLRQMGSSVTQDEKTDLIFVNEEWTVSVVLCRYQQTEVGTARWVIRLDEGLKPDITIAIRLDETNNAIHDYYLLPALDMTWGKLRMAEENGVYLDAYRFEALDYFYGMAERSQIEEAA